MPARDLQLRCQRRSRLRERDSGVAEREEARDVLGIGERQGGVLERGNLSWRERPRCVVAELGDDLSARQRTLRAPTAVTETYAYPPGESAREAGRAIDRADHARCERAEPTVPQARLRVRRQRQASVGKRRG